MTRYSAVFTGSACASGSAGTEGPRRIRLAVGGFQFDQCQVRLYGQDAAARVTGAERERGLRPGTTISEAVRLRQSEREVRELRQTNEILRRASAYFAQVE